MTEAKSTQPQLPPRPERVTDESGFYTLYQADEADAHMNALEAENESLKAQLAQWEQSYKSAVKGRQDFRSAMKLARKHQAVAEAERDQALEVIREYRKSKANHLEDCEDYSKWDRGQHSYRTHFEDDRCPTCIKADALLSREPKEEV